MAMQLRVRHIAIEDAARGGVPVLGRHEITRGLLDYTAVAAMAHGGHRLREMADRLVHGGGVRGLDLTALGLTGERPHR